MPDTANFKLLRLSDVSTGSGCACKAGTVHLGTSAFKTPIRTLDAAKSPTAESRIVITQAYRDLNEVYQRLSPEAVDSIDGESGTKQRFQCRLVTTDIL